MGDTHICLGSWADREKGVEREREGNARAYRVPESESSLPASTASGSKIVEKKLRSKELR